MPAEDVSSVSAFEQELQNAPTSIIVGGRPGSEYMGTYTKSTRVVNDAPMYVRTAVGALGSQSWFLHRDEGGRWAMCKEEKHMDEGVSSFSSACTIATLPTARGLLFQNPGQGDDWKFDFKITAIEGVLDSHLRDAAKKEIEANPLSPFETVAELKPFLHPTTSGEVLHDFLNNVSLFGPPFVCASTSPGVDDYSSC